MAGMSLTPLPAAAADVLLRLFTAPPRGAETDGARVAAGTAAAGAAAGDHGGGASVAAAAAASSAWPGAASPAHRGSP